MSNHYFIVFRLESQTLNSYRQDGLQIQNQIRPDHCDFLYFSKMQFPHLYFSILNSKRLAGFGLMINEPHMVYIIWVI